MSALWLPDGHLLHVFFLDLGRCLKEESVLGSHLAKYDIGYGGLATPMYMSISTVPCRYIYTRWLTASSP